MSNPLDRPSFNDPERLRTEQYATGSNLDARIALHQRFSTNTYGWQCFVFDALLELPEAARLLEVGCGTASLWSENAQRIPPGWQVTLTDTSPGMVEQAQANLQGVAANFNFERADADSLPFADGSFDGLIANHMLYHVPDLPAALAEFRRVLRPGGRLHAATNGAGHMLQQWELLARFTGVDSGDDWHGAVMRSFSLENGGAQLAPYFAQVERRDYVDALEVTEVAPLVAYIASMFPVAAEEAERFTDFIAGELEAAGGSLRMEKATGLFVAW
jgi:ubiquinone/menaquinone biosynthesis C-methylase UbiE